VNRRNALIAAGGCAALLTGGGLAWLVLRTQTETTAAVEALYRASFDDARGVAQPMDQWRHRWLVLNFWATWCAPCVEEMPGLQQVARDYADRRVAVVGLGIDRAEAIRRFQEELKLELPLLVAGAAGSDIARNLGNPTGALPYTVLISPTGEVVQSHLGLLQPRMLRSWLDARLTR
jgi:thiol-disulfide isomerase/thioredoxin